MNALAFARRWAEVVEKTFAGGAFDRAAYAAAYADQFSVKQKGAREIDFVDFYHLTLVRGLISPETEGHMLDYVLSKPDGIYYIYDKPLNQPPKIFTSKKASRYLAALELLADYPLAREKLGFALDWLESNRGADG